MAEEPDADAMVVVAAFVSRIEALVVASMLEAAGVRVMVGGGMHASVEVKSLALGGHRLWIPASQHEAASEVLREVHGAGPWRFSYGLRRAVLRVLALWASVPTAVLAVNVWLGGVGAGYLLLLPLGWLSLPVNPQGRGNYFLTAPRD